MQRRELLLGAIATSVATALPALTPAAALASEASDRIDRDVTHALSTLYRKTPAAAALGKEAKGILVFPKIVKAGLMVGGQGGRGALRKGRRTVGYYRTLALSYGLQAGAQAFGYALFFMTDDALRYLQESKGWEIGTGPSVVVADEGIARALSTTTARSDVYAFIFNQSGLMAGLGIQGSKITRIYP